MTGIITLQSAGSDTGPFDLYSNINNFTVPFENNLSKAVLAQGFQSNKIPTNTNIVRIKSVGICESFTDIPLFVGSIVVSAFAILKLVSQTELEISQKFEYSLRLRTVSSPILGITITDALIVKGTMFDNLNTTINPSLLSKPVDFEIIFLAGESFMFASNVITTRHGKGVSCQITSISKTSSTGSDGNFYIIT